MPSEPRASSPETPFSNGFSLGHASGYDLGFVDGLRAAHLDLLHTLQLRLHNMDCEDDDDEAF